EDGTAPYDRFRGRIIFPIRDGRGRAISLGGRAMDPNARAKYLNGPETPLFDKGRNLFNIGPAREAAGKGQPLIVAEGYMDVIALSEAGFRATVAPLGTAVTEDQLQLLWRIHDEPIIALDGDAAGIRAALRVVDLALPLLQAGKGLRFAILPQGMDPDDLIKAQGAPAMQRVLDEAQPMVRLLWRRETEGRVFDSPERKAALDKTLRAALKKIADPSIRSHYVEDMKRLRQELFGQTVQPFRPWVPRAPGGKSGRFAPPQPVAPAASTRLSLLASSSEPVQDAMREAVILATLLAHPALIHRFESALDSLDFSTGDHNLLRDLLLTHADAADPRAEIAKAAPAVLDALHRQPHVRNAPTLLDASDTDKAEFAVAQDIFILQAERGRRREIEEAAQDIEGVVDEGLTWRIAKANEARFQAHRGPQESNAEAVISPNGVALDKEELERARQLFDNIRYDKGRRRD
ncbi:MAG: hypothetical protein RIT14_2140, partial [Pseudomonadota bacterium]